MNRYTKKEHMHHRGPGAERLISKRIPSVRLTCWCGIFFFWYRSNAKPAVSVRSIAVMILIGTPLLPEALKSLMDCARPARTEDPVWCSWARSCFFSASLIRGSSAAILDAFALDCHTEGLRPRHVSSTCHVEERKLIRHMDKLRDRMYSCKEKHSFQSLLYLRPLSHILTLSHRLSHCSVRDAVVHVKLLEAVAQV